MDRRVQALACASLWIVLLKDNARSLRPLRGGYTIHTSRSWAGPHAQIVARPIRRGLGRASTLCPFRHGLQLLKGAFDGWAGRYAWNRQDIRHTSRTRYDQCLCSSLYASPYRDGYKHEWFWELASFL